MTTIIPGTPTFDRFQAVLIRGHLRLLNAGMTNSRMSGTKILAAASRHTGKTYKRGQYAAAVADLTEMINAAE